MAKGGARKGAGRKKGGSNRQLRPLRDQLKNFIDKNQPSLQKAFDKLSAFQKWQVMIQLYSFYMPKLAAQRIETATHNNDDIVTIFEVPDNGRQGKQIEEAKIVS